MGSSGKIKRTSLCATSDSAVIVVTTVRDRAFKVFVCRAVASGLGHVMDLYNPISANGSKVMVSCVMPWEM